MDSNRKNDVRNQTFEQKERLTRPSWALRQHSRGQRAACTARSCSRPPARPEKGLWVAHAKQEKTETCSRSRWKLTVKYERSNILQRKGISSSMNWMETYYLRQIQRRICERIDEKTLRPREYRSHLKRLVANWVYTVPRPKHLRSPLWDAKWSNFDVF